MARSVIIRGGQLIDAAARAANPCDILVIGDAIAEIGPPGLAAPPDAATFDASGTLMHPGLVNSHTHGLGNFLKGRADRWTLELLLAGGGEMWDGQTLEDKYLNAYLGAVEMLLKGCTTCYDLTYGVPLASAEELTAVGQAYLDAGMRAVLAPMIADITFYKAIPGLFDALPENLQAAVSAPDGGADLVLGADARRAARLVARPREGAARHRADHSAALLRRADRRLRGARQGIRHGAAVACRRIQGAGGLGAETLGQVADRAYRRTRPARSELLGRARGVARRRRHAPAGGSRRLGRAQCRQQHAARLRHRGCAPHARARRHARDRHRRSVMLGQPEHVRGDALRLARLERARPGLSPLAHHAGDHSRRDRRRRGRDRIQAGRHHRQGLQGRHRVRRTSRA